ncbi:glycoside hydrolase family 88 protein [Termitidicoccus mucosus]|uniref:Glycosyl hydrolase family 88 n=1 Tax=Termitidicoccus mucosus TaxID=1184151 RepID=A0A178IJI8_9BACT|nr:hypothetical protein AW736_09645 [Opitutaceae bacterium TSB47]
MTTLHQPGRTQGMPLHLVIASLALLATATIARASPLSAPTCLDAGPSSPSLSAATAYDEARGYGWITSRSPAGTFTLPQKFAGVRSAPLLDGVAGEDYTLRLDLAPGRWMCIAWLDDGYSNAHTVTLALNGRAIAHNPRSFGRESEPQEPPINRYRVAQFPIQADGDPTEISFRQAAPGGARLLALHLFPLDLPDTDTMRWLAGQVTDAGRHPFRASLDILRAELDRHGARAPELAAGCAYWKAQLDLLAEAERWHRAAGWDEVSLVTRSSMFTRYKIAVSLLDPLVDHPDGDAFPLRDRARWLRARLLYWLWQEQHHEGDNTAYQADLAILRQKYPGDNLIAMYAGEKVPNDGAGDGGRFISSTFRPFPTAPAWSSAQYEALHRLRDIAHYWVDERQISNGEFGGKTDDDVELLRWWPVLMFSGDTKVRDGFAKLANGMWFSPKIHLGYCREPRDVEHSAEYVSDTMPMMALLTRDPAWIDRLAYSHRHMRDLWTGINTHGDRHFKSAWLGATEILTEPPRNRDLSMNARAAKAVRYYAWLANDPDATGLLRDWSLSWAKAAARTDKGKPSGLFPASIRYPDGAINGDEPAWHRANMFWRYFDWGADGRLYDQLLYSWLTSGDTPAKRDARLLQPMLDTLVFLEKQTPVASSVADGSPAWAAARLMDSSEFWNIVTQWRLETNDTRHDAFLIRHGPPYLRYRLTGDTAPLAETINTSILEVLRYNRPLRTSEVLFTDRVRVAQDDGNTTGDDTLAAMLTGCHTAQGFSPYYHVAWEHAPQSLTALVTSTGPDHVAADIFLHQTSSAEIIARCFRLPPGDYRLTLVDAAGKTLLERAEIITAPDHRATLTVPGAILVSMKMMRIGAPQVTSRSDGTSDSPVSEHGQAAPLQTSLAAANIVLRDSVFAFREVPWRAPQGIQILEQHRRPVPTQTEFTLAESGTVHFGVAGDGIIEVQIDDAKAFTRDFSPSAAPREYAYDRFRWPAGFTVPLAAGTHHIRVSASSTAFLQACDSHGETDRRVRFSEWRPASARSPVRDFAIKPEAAFKKHSLVEWHYATGVTHLALLEAADALATSDPAAAAKLRAHVDRFAAFTLENLPWQRDQYQNTHAWRAANFRLFRGCLLDDTSAPALPFIELLRRNQLPSSDAAALIDSILDFVLSKHSRLADGTLSRDEPEPQTVWADDLFMSATFLVRAAEWKKDPRIHDEVVRQAQLFHRHLHNPATGLYWHGYYASRQTPAPFHWARANGWMAWAMSECIRFLPATHPARVQLIALHRGHLAALLRHQSASGLWHQVLDKPESFEETSASAMYLIAMIRGMKGGWLDRDTFAVPARRAWAGLQTRIDTSGVVRGICGGTAIGDSYEHYFNRPQPSHDPRGIGAFIAAAALAAALP